MQGSKPKKSENEIQDPVSIKPRELFDSPRIEVLCAKDVEGQFYERKSKREPERIAETICAFANSNREHGGMLAIGISDDGKLEYPGSAGGSRVAKGFNGNISRS